MGQIYRRALERLPELFATRTQEFCFGPAAFRAWADEIERGGYQGLEPEEFQRDKWFYYTNYICILATNGTCCTGKLRQSFGSTRALGTRCWLF